MRKTSVIELRTLALLEIESGWRNREVNLTAAPFFLLGLK